LLVEVEVVGVQTVDFYQELVVVLEE